MPPPITLPQHPDVRVTATRLAWNGRFPLQLVTFSQRRFDGSWSAPREWELWRRGEAASILPYDPDTDQFVLIEQFRVPAYAGGLDPVMLEVPAGICDGTEAAETTVVRELGEEVGLRADRTERIGHYLLSPGGCDERCTLFVGRVRAPAAGPDGIVGHGGLASEGEDLRVRVCDAAPLLQRALAGAFPNAVLSLSLFWFASQHARLRAAWRA